MDAIDRLFSCSETLLNVLQHENDNRDGKVQHVLQLIDEREKIIEEIKKKNGYQLKNHPKARKFVEMENKIQKEMHRLYEEIRSDLKKWTEKKKLQKMYINLFEQVEISDGRFYDKKQ